ncbi:uncharacterized protein V6R79_003939 [Siganus canaliculatus]
MRKVESVVGPEKGDDRERERERARLVRGEEAAIVTGRRETTVKGKDGGARDKSFDGNACHIDEATAREAGNEDVSTVQGFAHCCATAPRGALVNLDDGGDIT